MSGPLVPVPELPFAIQDDEEETVEISASFYDGNEAALIQASMSGAWVTTEQAPRVAAAILRAADCTHHRVIDLGGELPVVERDGDGWIVGETGRWADEDGDDVIREQVLTGLAVLQARAATPRHDERDVRAVAHALADLSDRSSAEAADDALEDEATRILDALAAARAERES